jgi:hypothetical protein
MGRQLCIELAMRGTVEALPLDLTVCGALIGIKESSEPGMSEIYTELFFGNRYSPKSFGRVRRVGNAKPECRSRLAHA